MGGAVVDDVALAEALGTGFRGRLIATDDPDYEDARKLFNAMIVTALVVATPISTPGSASGRRVAAACSSRRSSSA